MSEEVAAWPPDSDEPSRPPESIALDHAGRADDAHHRLVNVLQLLTSLAGFRLRRAEHQAARAELIWLQNAVRAIGLIHDGDGRTGDFAGRLSPIVDSWRPFFRECGVVLDLQVTKPIPVAREDGVALALAVVEILDGFSRAGLTSGTRLGVRLDRRPHGACLLEIAEDGQGGEERAALAHAVALVEAFVRQLGGRVSADPQGGWVRIEFTPAGVLRG